MRALLCLFVLLVVLAPACGGRGNLGESCEANDECVTELCLVACSDPCRAAGKESPVACGPKYCALPTAPEATSANSWPCHAR
jgi:hypothetical protein